jgi:hypothetical protein
MTSHKAVFRQIEGCKKYSLGDYGKHNALPSIARVTKGYQDSKCEDNTVGNGDVLYLLFEREDRFVVASDRLDRTLMIPLDSLVPFIRVRSPALRVN